MRRQGFKPVRRNRAYWERVDPKPKERSYCDTSMGATNFNYDGPTFSPRDAWGRPVNIGRITGTITSGIGDGITVNYRRAMSDI